MHHAPSLMCPGPPGEARPTLTLARMSCSRSMAVSIALLPSPPLQTQSWKHAAMAQSDNLGGQAAPCCSAQIKLLILLSGCCRCCPCRRPLAWGPHEAPVSNHFTNPNSMSRCMHLPKLTTTMLCRSKVPCLQACMAAQLLYPCRCASRNARPCLCACPATKRCSSCGAPHFGVNIRISCVTRCIPTGSLVVGPA